MLSQLTHQPQVASEVSGTEDLLTLLRAVENVNKIMIIPKLGSYHNAVNT